MVRHGESEGNTTKSVQSPTEPLTANGLTQAKNVINRLKHIDAELVISSSASRAHKTAEIIASSLKLDHKTSDLFIERKHPTRFHGMQRSNPTFVEYEKIRDANIHDPMWRFEDGDTFFDVKGRAQKAKEHLEYLPYEKLIVVTHGIFLRSFLPEVILGDKYTPDLHNGFMKCMTSNTGISVFETVEKTSGGVSWHLITWNDHSHLPS